MRRFLAIAQTIGVPPPEIVADTRAQLEHVVGARWTNLQFRFLLRQLAFHLADGTTFLRVERPYQHGDSALGDDGLVAATIASRRMRSGFEIGPFSTGLRAPTPGGGPAVPGGRDQRGVVEVGASGGAKLVAM